MNLEHYRQKLLELERRLSSDIDRESAVGRGQTADTSRDAADASVADEAASEEFASAQRDSDVLAEVRQALGRIDNGTYGRCAVDGGPIEEKRLEAVPWTRYCLRHQNDRAGSKDMRSTM